MTQLIEITVDTKTEESDDELIDMLIVLSSYIEGITYKVKRL
jgi:hypothetical protein